MRLGLDLSNYSLVPSAEQLAALKAAGYEYCIPGTQTGLDGNCYTQQQIDAFKGAGFEVPAVYVFLYFDGKDQERVKDATKYGLPVWLDCEYEQGSSFVEGVLNAVNLLGPRCAGIYTRETWWRPYMGNSLAFSHLPLWNADYRPYLPDFNYFAPYGGWERPTIWQFSSRGDAGVNADLDVMEDAPVPVPPAPLPDWKDVAGAGADAAIKLRRGEPLKTMLESDKAILRDVVSLL